MKQVKRAGEVIAGSLAWTPETSRVDHRYRRAPPVKKKSLVERIFDRVYGFVASLGRNESAAKRKARQISEANFTEFRRLSPSELKKIGHTPKSRHYVLSTVKRVTKNTAALAPATQPRPAPPGRALPAARDIEGVNLRAD